MGNSQPTNKTNRQATAQKLENAKKLGILSLTEHSLEEIPRQLYEPDLAKKLKTLDLSNNKITKLSPKFATLVELKSLNLDNNKLLAGTLSPVSKLTKLQKLSLSSNRLGQLPAQQQGGKTKAAPAEAIFPELPTALREINMASNSLFSVPRSLLSPSLSRLEKVDLSGNQLASVGDIWILSNLVELQLDSNMIASLPEEIGTLKKLKVLSLRNNEITSTSKKFSETNPQPLPKSLFTDTPLIDLNLHGNRMTNTELNDFQGFQDFLDRRQKVKRKTNVNLSVCGLK